MKKMVSYFPWRNDFNLNVSAMDTQHRDLVSIINDLQQAVNEGEGNEKLGKILDSLLAYTDKHFAAEEKLMKKHGYPEYEEHKKKHIAMRGKVHSLIRDYKGGKVSITFAVLKFLQDWLIKHIMGTDKKYGIYLNGKGVR